MRQDLINYKKTITNPPRPSNRPPRLRHPPVTSRGPRYLEKRAVHTGGPQQPPAGFITASNSIDEWMWYWASMRALDPNRDPREPPYYGGLNWDYQSPELGGFTRALGSAVVDFLYKLSQPFIVVRIQTFRFHLAAPAQKQAFDQIQNVALSRKFEVVDVYSQDYIGDDTGETAVIQVKETLGLVRRENPLSAGTTLLIRPGLNL
jgi:hypothetical protein